MISAGQIEANKRNALKSRGPKTAKGKSVSRFNAMRHGLTAEEILLPGEDADSFQDLQQRLLTELDPLGTLERELVNRLTALLWRLRRTNRIETGVLQLELSEKAEPDFFEMIEPDGPAEEEKGDGEMLTSEAIGSSFRSAGYGSDPLGKLARYETSLDRSVIRTVRELERIQNNRRKNETEPAPLIEMSGKDEAA